MMVKSWLGSGNVSELAVFLTRIMICNRFTGQCLQRANCIDGASGVIQNQLSGFLGNHIGRGTGVSIGKLGHYGRVNDAKLVNPMQS